ncbi:hypothetical protein scyTo_0025996, partial [Scyliorhinus torazame]|nr:hypothetical protein [Scyliorhinus torazame]
GSHLSGRRKQRHDRTLQRAGDDIPQEESTNGSEKREEPQPGSEEREEPRVERYSNRYNTLPAR